MKLSSFPLPRSWLAALGIVLAPFTSLAQSSLPNAQVGVPYTFQVTTNPPAAAGSVYGASSLPPGLGINASSGLISGTPSLPGVYNGSITITSGASTNAYAIRLLVNGAAGTPVVTSAASASATVGTPITPIPLAATNSPTSFNVGALPPGLSVAGPSTAPTLTGTPTQAGTFPVTVSANNASGTGTPATLTLAIGAPTGAPVVTSAAAVSAGTTTAFNYQVTATNSPSAFAASGLPLGLSLNPATGLVSGTATVAGIYPVTLTAANAAGTSAAFTVTITVGALPAITSPLNASGIAGAAFFHQLAASNSPASFNVGALPAGLSVNPATGAISGTPAATGVTSVLVSANNATGSGAVSTLVITIAAPGGGGGGGGFPPPVAGAPVIASHPASQSAPAGSSVTFSVSASGSSLSFQWSRDGTPLPNARGASLTLTNVGAADAGAYAVVVTNPFGAVTSATATLTVLPAAPLFGIATQPAAQSVTAGGAASFTVVASGSGPFTYQWFKDGAALLGATNATLSLANLTAGDAGAYAVVVTAPSGALTSASATLTVLPAAAPVIVTQPASQSVAPGGVASFSVVASGSAPLSYQWSRNGQGVASATSATLTLPAAGPADAGSYTVTVSNAAGSVTSAPAVLTVTAPIGRLINLSSRGLVGTGDRQLIAGFVVQGTAPRPVLLRAVGPTLATFGLAGTLADPVLELFRGSTSAATNDNWPAAANAAAISATASRVGAFALGATSADAVILVTLEPGAYTAQMRGTGTTTGLGLVEIYDAGETPSGGRLINVATRAEVGAGGNILIAGFVIDGEQPKRVLLRAAGPALAGLGVSGALADPQLQLFAGNVLRAENDNWDAAQAGAGEIARAATAAGAFAFSAGSRDAALLVDLAPGAYTAQVSGVGTATGIAIVEVYEVAEAPAADPATGAP